MKKTTSEHLADYDFVVNYSVASVDKNKDQAWLLLATQELMMTKVFGSLQKILGLIQPKLGCFSCTYATFHGLACMIRLLTIVTYKSPCLSRL